MKQFSGLVVLALVFALAVPAWAQVTQSGGTRNLSPGDTIQAGASATATGGSVGNVSAHGGTHVQSNTQINTQVTSQQQGQQQGQGQVQGQSANNDGNHQSVSIDTPRQAPPAIAPALSISSLTCYGSWGIGASTPFGGISMGFPTKEDDCERARNAVILVSLGYKDAALALLAQNGNTAQALKVAGVKYPGEKAEALKPVAAAPKTEAMQVTQNRATDIPAAMRATLAARADAVQGQ